MIDLTSTIRTLIIEDNPGDADLVIERASSEPHRKISFEVQESLSAGLQSISDSAPDIVLLDPGLPDSMGIPTFEKLHQSFPDVPVIILTGNDDVDLAVRCIELGAQDFLVKGKTESFIAGAIQNTFTRARAQKALEETRENLERIIENSPDAILVLDTARHVLFANDNAAHMLGKKAETGVVFDLFSINEPSSEFEWENEDGTIASLALRLGKTLWYDNPAFILTIRDITARRKAEQDKERLLAAIEQTEDTVYMIDLEGKITYLNPAFETCTGYPKQEALGQHISLLGGEEKEPKIFKRILSVLTSGKVWKGRMQHKRKNGLFFTVDSTITPVHTTDEKQVSFVAVNRDITEHLRIQEEKILLEEQLQQSQKLESVGRLAAGIAHDFNNMLSVILGNAQMIQFRLKPGTPLHNEVSMIEEAGKRSAELTKQLLAFSRKQNLQPSFLDLNDIIRKIETMLRRLIGENIDIQLALTPLSSPVLIDQRQLEQVIINLAVNAQDAMPNGGIILLETNSIQIDDVFAASEADLTPGPYMQLAITDNGIGIPSTVIEKIFDPFFTTKGVGEGTGLGLSMVYGLIKQSGGTIQVYSEENHGTTFKIYLPQSAPISESISESTSKPTPQIPSTSILVVEDEKIVRTHLYGMLQELGHTVTLASNGLEAIQLIEERRLIPGLMITDIVMPHLNGLDLSIRAHETLPNLKVLYMSGYTDQTIATHGLLPEGSPFIEKPFTYDSMKNKIESLLLDSRAT